MLRKVWVEEASGSAEIAMLKELEAQISVRVQTPTTVRIRVPVGMRILIDPI